MLQVFSQKSNKKGAFFNLFDPNKAKKTLFLRKHDIYYE